MVDPECAHSGVLLCICLQKDTLIYTKKCFFLSQNYNFKYVHVTSRSLHSGSESREIISGGFVTVPFSQSLTLDLWALLHHPAGLICSGFGMITFLVNQSRHITQALSQLCAFMVTVEDTLYFVWCELWVVQTDDTWSSMCFASTKLSHQKFWVKLELAEWGCTRPTLHVMWL